MNDLRNSVQLIGNLGDEVTLTNFENGNILAKFPLATNEYYTDKKGEKAQNTQWHTVVAWGKKAEYMSKSLAKGNQVLIHGKIVYRSYEDKDGIKRYSSEIVADSFVKFN